MRKAAHWAHSIDGENRLAILSQFRWSLQALAVPAEAQRALFPEFVCKADELALDYDHWAQAARASYGGEFSDEQRDALRAIDRRLVAMSRGGAEFDEGLWSDVALNSRPEWEQVRSLAGLALSRFDWPCDAPPRGRSFYVPSRPLRDSSER